MKQKKTLIVLLCILGVVVLSAIGYFIYQKYFVKSATESNTAKKSAPSAKKAICPLDGLSVNENLANRHPLAVMVENHTDARPQSGLENASLVYEAIAEGGITRFMAVYVWGEPEKVGPVRSARTYYVDWAEEINAFYAHVGGNIDALDKIKAEGVLDLDQFKYGTQAYWREPQAGKATEHTMFASAKKLWDIATKNKWDQTGSYTTNKFKTEAEKSQRPATQTLTVNFSTTTYQVKWVYDPTTNSYKREQTKTPEIKAKNIIVQWVTRTPTVTKINESGWIFAITGTGKIEIYQDGKKSQGTWKKEGKNRTVFYDTTGTEVKLNPGQTWIEVVHSETSVTST